MTTTEACRGHFTCLCIATLALDQSSELPAQERGNGETTLRGEDARFAQRFFIERKGDVARRGHRKHV
jgi:hypothetical protein